MLGIFDGDGPGNSGNSGNNDRTRVRIIMRPNGERIQRTTARVPNGTIVRERVLNPSSNNNRNNSNNNRPNQNMFQSFIMDEDHMEDENGRFSLFGQSPDDPMMSSRVFTDQRTRSNDPFEAMLSNFVNMIRMNRGSMRNPGFVRILINGANGGGPRNRGMNRENLNKIDVIKFKKDKNVKEGEEEKCPICMMEIEDGEEVKKLPCGHIFHAGCIDPWLVRNSKCPICKRDVNEGLNSGNSGS